MKIPKNIKIFARHYKVIRSNDAAAQFSPGCWGLIDYEHSEIVVKPRADNFQEFKEAETLLHEIIHGVDESLMLKLSENKVNLLAAGLVTVFRDNKLNFSDET
jgi:hypothetical protein